MELKLVGDVSEKAISQGKPIPR